MAQSSPTVGRPIHRRRVRGELRQLAKGLAFCSPWIVGFTLFVATPVAMSFYYSFCDYPLLQKPLYIGGANYHRLLSDPLLGKSILNTFYYASMALPGAVLISLGLALLLNLKLAGQGLYRTLIFLPSLVPTVAAALIWLWMFNSNLGLFNYLLSRVGIHGPAWLADKRWAMPSLALMSFWGVGNTVVIYLAGLQDVPAELYEAAEIDGANSARRLWHVTLPLLSPVIFFNLVMAIIQTLQVLTIPYIMTEGGPENATYFFSMYIYDNAFRYLQMGYASALAGVLFLMILGLTGVAFWTARRWVHYR